jgi:hypothetical protein
MDEAEDAAAEEGLVMRLWRFAFAVVLAMHAWSSMLLADDTVRTAELPFQVTMPHTYTLTGRPEYLDNEPELTATKGDIDAINTSIAHLEQLLRCVLRNQETVSVARNATVQENCP